MRYEGLTALVIFFAGFIFAPAASAQQKNKQHQKWEYKIIDTCNFEDPKRDMQQLGEEGWELVTTDLAPEGRCAIRYFKRPKGADSKPVAKQPPQKPTAPQCSLPLGKAPTVRGLRLGMSSEELMSFFHPNTKSIVEYALKNADSPPNYGLAAFEISGFNGESKEVKEKFAGVHYLRFKTLDGRVVEISVSYDMRSPQLYTSWTINEWTAKISNTFGLTGADNWQSSQNKNERTLKCDEFEVVVSVVPYQNPIFLGVGAGFSTTYMTITDPSYRRVIEQRAKTDREKKQREFVF